MSRLRRRMQRRKSRRQKQRLQNVQKLQELQELAHEEQNHKIFHMIRDADLQNEAGGLMPDESAHTSKKILKTPIRFQRSQ